MSPFLAVTTAATPGLEFEVCAALLDVSQEKSCQLQLVNKFYVQILHIQRSSPCLALGTLASVHRMVSGSSKVRHPPAPCDVRARARLQSESVHRQCMHGLFLFWSNRCAGSCGRLWLCRLTAALKIAAKLCAARGGFGCSLLLRELRLGVCFAARW